MNGRSQHFTSISQLNREDILLFFETLKKNKSKGFTYSKPILKDEVVALIFLEPSTRTRVSFEIAAKRLGGIVTHVQHEGTSMKKGETIQDTFATIHAMGCRYFVLRSADSNVQKLSDHFGDRIVLINAGDGINEHPTQALIDGFTIWERFPDFSKLKIAIIGDIDRSRVAHSNIKLLNLLGNKPFIHGPAELTKNLSEENIHRARDISDALAHADVVMMLRVQNERSGITFALGEKDYLASHGLTPNRLKLANANAIVMHPGPFNRNVEIDSSLADGPQSVILNQVNNGIWVRMALFEMLQKGMN